MTRELLHENSSGLVRGLTGVLLATIAAIGLIALLFESGFSNISTASFVCLLATPWLIVLLFHMGGGSLTQVLLSPTGLMLVFVWSSILIVPILWATGLANPWFDFPLGELNLVVVSAALSSMVLTVGVLLGLRRSRAPVALAAPGGGLRRASWVAFLCVLGAALWVSSRTGGISYLLGNLLSKRELLAGLGPATALAAVGGIAGLTVPSVYTADRSTRVAGNMCAIAYLGYLFVMGSRFPMIAYALALLVARSARAQVPRRALALVLVAIIPFSVWYSVSVRGGQQLESGRAGTRSASTLIDPFVYGGLDILHSQGAVAVADLPDWRFSPDLILGQLTTVIPRSILPGKRPGMSTVFSEVFFPVSWSNGSGVPPALTAELAFTWGVVGGLGVLAIVGFLLARGASLMGSSRHLAVRLIYPFFTVDCIVLAKSGSDAFLQQFTLQLGGTLLFLAITHLTGAKLRAIQDE